MYINDTTKEQQEWEYLRTSSGASIPPEGTNIILGTWYYILPSNKPEFDPITQKLVEIEPIKIDNKYYRTYSIVACSQEEINANIKARIEYEIDVTEIAISENIQSEIDKYNLAIGVKFLDINAIQKYTIDNTYSNYAFCLAILTWNIQIWETSRALQIQIATGQINKPDTVEEFLALLPPFTFEY